jgi:hypothetical protein
MSSAKKNLSTYITILLNLIECLYDAFLIHLALINMLGEGSTFCSESYGMYLSFKLRYYTMEGQ